MIATDILGIKIQNIDNIIHAVRYEDKITKREVAERIGLSFTTVSNLCNEMIEAGILETQRDDALAVGRTPKAVSFRYNRYCVIAINLQLRGMIEIAILNFRNEVLAQKSYQIDDRMSAEEMVHYARKKFEKELRIQVEQDTNYIGIGVAVSSIYDIRTSKLICCAIPQLEGVAMKELVEREFGLPAFVDNEANLCAVAVGAESPGNEHAVYIHASEGLGVGIVSAGSIFQGSNGYAGEVAHMPIGDPKHLCFGCGGSGCIERELNVDGILENYTGTRTSENRIHMMDDFRSALKRKDARALDTVSRAGVYLGRLTGVLVNLFDPDTIYIGGNIAELQEYIEAIVQKEVDQKCCIWRKKSPGIVWDHESARRILVGLSDKICTNWSPKI